MFHFVYERDISTAKGTAELEAERLLLPWTSYGIIIHNDNENEHI